MVKAKQDEPVGHPDSPEAQEDEGNGIKSPPFTMTEDMAKFSAFWDVTRPEGTEPLRINTYDEQAKFNIEYNNWVSAGRPRPEFKTKIITDAPPIPQKLYRHKVKGKQWMYLRTTDGKMYGKTGDGLKAVFDMPFTKEEAKKKCEDAEARCENPTYYIVLRDGSKYSISQNDFYAGDYDDLETRIRKKQYNF